MIAHVTRRRGAKRRHGAAVLAAAFLAASCSSGGDDADDAASAPTVASTAVSSPATASAAATTAPGETSTPGETTVETVPGTTTGATTQPSDPAATPPGEQGAEELAADADFYAVPDPIPDPRHGTLLRYQAVEPALHEGSRTWRIMYTSESHAGEPIVVTGLAAIPTGAAPPDGRPIITLVHGTTGSADRCAPSKTPGAAGELLLLGPSVGAGSIVAATDYEGQGTPGVHPYLVGESEGRSGLDAALAVRQLPGADAGSQLGVMGYSQGGHSAMWTAELAADWAPELDLVGTFAGAPPTEIGLVVGARLTGAPASFILLLVAGFQQAYGDDADAGEFLSKRGLARLPDADRLCIGDLAAASADFAADAYLPGADAGARWSDLASENDAGTEAVDAPLLIIHSVTDDVVPAALSQTAFDRLCGLGQVVDRRSPDLGGHGAAAVPAYEQAQRWMQNRFDGSGKAAVSTCPAPATG